MNEKVISLLHNNMTALYCRDNGERDENVSKTYKFWKIISDIYE